MIAQVFVIPPEESQNCDSDRWVLAKIIDLDEMKFDRIRCNQ